MDGQGSKLARYEAWSELSNEINSLGEIADVANVTVSRLEHVADVFSLRYLGVAEDFLTYSNRDRRFLVIDGFGGTATTSTVLFSDLSEFERTLWQEPKTCFLHKLEITELRETLPEHFQDDSITQLYACCPQFTDGKLHSIFVASSRDESFSELDVKFLKMVSQFLHGKVSYIQREKAITATLVQTEKMISIGKLTASLLHELNSPAGVLKSSADIASRTVGKLNATVNKATAREVADNSTYRKCIRTLNDATESSTNATDRILEIINNLKSFIRLDEAELLNADLHKGLDAALALIRNELSVAETRNPKQIEIIKAYCSDAHVLCDAGQINQVLLILLQRAVQDIDEQGTITVKTFKDEKNVYITISETGKGLSRDELVSIFDLNFTASDSRMGMGLDLALAYNMIRKHGGDVKVESEAGHGSKFTIELPITFDESRKPQK